MPNLIGTGNNQVPTNGMLGGLAYQSPDNAVIKNLELTSLSGHNSLIPSTAVDVFVYDTRKDSDGGAWRKRTQHTSWYNETLNTPTRGSRRDFPAVAVIVVSATIVTIYDGDDPDMPMWMVIPSNTVDWAANPGDATSAFALNGTLCITTIGAGTLILEFISDRRMIAYTTPSYQFTDKLISSRNNSSYTSGGGYTILSASCNDVAMTVLPNAPINPSTGLPVPTIAVATQGGVSVITDSETIYNLTPESDPSYASIKNFYSVGFDSNNRIFFTDSQTTGGYSALIYLPNYDYNQSLTDYYSSLTGSYNYVWGGDIRSTSTPQGSWNVSSTTRIIRKSVKTQDSIAIGYTGSGSNDNGLSLIGQQNNYLLNCRITTSYNTGWLFGYTQGAWLSDTSTASVTGTELNQYGDFASTTGWGSRSAAWTISGGVASVSSGAGYQLLGLTSGTLTNGRKYVVTVNVTAFTAGRLELSQANSSNIQFNLGSTGTKTLVITYTGTTGQALGIYGYGDASYSFTIDDLYVRELSEADRSVNNTGLAVYGTITKSIVDTGANLVGYSGWNKSNYLLRPSGVTDLNNTSMTIMTWYKCSGNNEEEAIISTGDYNTISEVRSLYITPSGIAGFSGWANDFNPGSRNVRDNLWHHLAFTLQYISGTSYIVRVYVDGVLTGVSERSLLTFSNTAIDIGGGTVPLNRFARGSLALSRISTSVVPAEQMLKIYNDEKVLFQPNSQCTLYGSSDAVTALAYDDTTKLVHVGTSSGRSDFQGLERINNTTTAVTTAISASNGLIAEQ